MPQHDDELVERARRKGRRGSISAECSSGDPKGQDFEQTASRRVPMRRPSDPNERSQIRNWLSSHFLFSTIKNQETWNEILLQMEHVQCSEGDAIIEQGSLDADFMYVVDSGEFGVWLDGTQLNVVYSSGACFGELALMYQCPRQATVRCTSGPGALWSIGRTMFKQILVRQERHTGETFLPTLKRNWVFRDYLSDSELERVADVMCAESIEGAGSVVIQQGQSNLTQFKLYIILSGTCVVKKRDKQVRTLIAGDYFGERAILERRPRTASVETTSSRVELATLDSTSFERLLRKPCFKAFVKRIEYGYERCRHNFMVEDRRYPTNIPILASKRFNTVEAFVKFLGACTEDDSKRSHVFWVVDCQYPTSISSLVGRFFPNVESFVSYMNASRSSSPSLPASASKLEQIGEQMAQMIAKKRGRRGSVSGESTSEERVLIKKTSSGVSASMMDDDLRAMLRKHFLFSDLAPQELDFVLGEMVEQRYKKGDAVIAQNDTEANFFYVVSRGRFVVDKDGLRLPKVEYGRGSAFGELALMYLCPRQATVLCDSDDGALYALNREAFRSILVGARKSMRDRHETFLKERVALFESWPKEAIAKVADVTEDLVFSQGAEVIKEGDSDWASMRLYFLQSGTVDVIVGEDVVRTILPGGYFGERAILNRCPRSATCKASSAEEVRCLALDVSAFERLLGPLKSVLKGRSRTYIIESTSPHQHNLSLMMTPGETLDKSVHQATGWFKVGGDVFKTNIEWLNCKVFRNAEEYTSAFARLTEVKPPNADDDVMGASCFTVRGDDYPTRIESLKGRTFLSVEDFARFCQNPREKSTPVSSSFDI